MIRKCMSTDISFSFTAWNGFTCARLSNANCVFIDEQNFLKKKVRVFEHYFLHIRAFHSYDTLDQSTRKSANSWLDIWDKFKGKDKNGWPENIDSQSVDPSRTHPWTTLRTGPQTPFTDKKNRRNMEVCEIVDNDEASWIPGTMPYDPLDTIRLIQQRIHFLLDFFRTFELNLNYIAIAVWRKKGK